MAVAAAASHPPPPANFQVTAELYCYDDEFVHSIAVCRTSLLLAVAVDDGKVLFFDGLAPQLECRESRLRLPACGCNIVAMQFCRNGRLLAAANGDSIDVIDMDIVFDKVARATQGAWIVRQLAFNDQVTSIAFSHTDRVLAAATYDGELSLWCVDSWTRLRVVPGVHVMPYSCLLFSPDETRLIGAAGYHGNCTVTVVDCATGRKLFSTDSVHTQGFIHACWSPDGAVIAIPTETGSVRIVDSVSGTLVAETSRGALWDTDTGTQFAQLPEKTVSVVAGSISSNRIIFKQIHREVHRFEMK